MKPVLLVARSGEKPFPRGLLSSFEVVERVTHSLETVEPAPGPPAGPFDLVIVTSRAGADRLGDRNDLAVAGWRRIIAAGPATARRLRERLRGIAGPEDGGGSAEKILERLPADLEGARVLLPRGEDADERLPRELRRRGADVVPLVLYRKKAAAYDAALDALLASRTTCAFCATSPAAARWLFGGASYAARERLRDTTAIVLGDSTAAVLEAEGVARIVSAIPPTFESVARIAADLAARPAPA